MTITHNEEELTCLVSSGLVYRNVPIEDNVVHFKERVSVSIELSWVERNFSIEKI